MPDPGDASESAAFDPARLDADGAFDSDGVYVCDSCGEEIVIPLDPVEGAHQTYVEDCPVCCHPSVIHVDWDEGRARVWAEPEQDRY